MKSTVSCKAVCRAFARALAAALPAAYIAMTVARASDDTLRHQEGLAVDIVDVILEWRAHFDKPVIVTGALICRNEDECNFVAIHGLNRVVNLDVSLLPTDRKRKIVLSCHDRPCTVTLAGRVLDDGIIVRSILLLAEGPDDNLYLAGNAREELVR